MFSETDMNRQRTARQSHIHPKIIDYRVRRIGQLTGFAPARSDTTPQALPDQPLRSA
ncbi:helix-turn-helix domain-containing protein [Nocardia africana]|uniref:Helix-turn-helix domain-containing protein n=1 Tax=Nocardia africana TaxID=134964 RepID=A0ABW6NUV9_9NOCA